MRLMAYLPDEKYWFGDNKEEAFLFANFFIKLKLLDYLKDNPQFLELYEIDNFDRPDVIAHKLYKNSNLFWTLFLANDVYDPKDWLMSDRSLDTYTKRRYGEKRFDVAFHLRNGVISSPEAAQVALHKNPFNTVDSDPNEDSFNVTDPNSYQEVTNFAAEEMANDSKRFIRAIRKEYMSAFLRHVEQVIREAGNV
jgi:hypothetical protein